MKKSLKQLEKQSLIETLKSRFEKNIHRHKGLNWKEVEDRLNKHPEKFWSLNEMEISGGEPDVIDFNKKDGSYTFCDCSPESPAGRRSLCYDEKALKSRKENKPKDSAFNSAKEMGIELLNEEQYHKLQEIGNFDTKTSSWLVTPNEIRERGGAIFGDFRYGRVFIYHNGAESYYAARGFRGMIKV